MIRYTINQEPNDTGWIVTAYHGTNEPEVTYFRQLDAALAFMRSRLYRHDYS